MDCARLRRGCRGDHDPPPHCPWPGRPPQGLDHRNSVPPQAISLDRTVLLVPVDGYLLEVRDTSVVRGRFLFPLRAPPPPEIRHEEPAQRPPHRLRSRLLLDLVLRYWSRCEDRSAEQEDREVEERRVNAVEFLSFR